MPGIDRAEQNVCDSVSCGEKSVTTLNPMTDYTDRLLDREARSKPAQISKGLTTSYATTHDSCHIRMVDPSFHDNGSDAVDHHNSVLVVFRHLLHKGVLATWVRRTLQSYAGNTYTTVPCVQIITVSCRVLHCEVSFTVIEGQWPPGIHRPELTRCRQ